MPALAMEICIGCDDPAALAADCRAALAGGAATLELCRDMQQQGLTPQAGDLRIAREAFSRPGLYPMIRPRAGDFVYSGAEITTMIGQIDACADLGADGVVFGALQGRRLDIAALQRLLAIARARQLRTTFHRAFDAVDDGAAALEILADLGVDRIMTSGTAWGSGGSAADGAATLAALIEQAGPRVEIVLGGGIAAPMLPALLQQLPLPRGRVSAHAYGAALRDGRVDALAVAALVQAATT